MNKLVNTYGNRKIIPKRGVFDDIRLSLSEFVVIHILFFKFSLFVIEPYVYSKLQLD